MSNKRQIDENNNNKKNNSRRSKREINERDMELEENNNNNNNEVEGEGEELVFEDPFGDEFEDEEIIEEDLDEDDDEDNEDNQRENIQDESKISGNEPQTRVWRPGVDALEEGETLDYDPSAYVTYHSLRTEWPCLSFDILRDNLGEGRIRFPLSMLIVAGSQADRAEKNKITVLKISDVQKTQANESDDEDEEDDDNEDEDPTLEHVNINHVGGVNRIRAMPQDSGIIATMADTGKAHVFDITRLTRSMMIKGPRAAPPHKPAYTFKGHREEGYAIDWSPVTAGQLATGDCAGGIYIWNNVGNGSGGTLASSFKVSKAYLGHNGSVEDLQWSPTESTVFSSSSVDRTVRIWDTRGKNGPQITIDAHETDVNVISWNKNVNYLLASGCDDGSFKVWDLRAIREAQPLAHFRHHRQPVTSIEWAPHDESMLTISSADNTITTWDLSVESDDVPDLDETAQQQVQEYPPQLLFIHQGQTNIKEIHHHPQIPGLILSSAEDSFNLYKPAITVSSSS